MSILPGGRRALRCSAAASLVVLAVLGCAGSLSAQLLLPGRQPLRWPGPGSIDPPAPDQAFTDEAPPVLDRLPPPPLRTRPEYDRVPPAYERTPPALGASQLVLPPFTAPPTAPRSPAEPRTVDWKAPEDLQRLPANRRAPDPRAWNPPPANNSAPTPATGKVVPALATAPVGEDPYSAAGILQIGCRNCGTGALGGLLDGLHAASPPPSGGGCLSCTNGQCVPGRKPCAGGCNADSTLGRFLCGVYECICCPDPCYDPQWLAVADAAFFVDSARPQTQMRLGWDHAYHMVFPDRSEYFWARADGMGRGPTPPKPLLGERALDYDILSLYTEVATGNFGLIVNMPYRSIDPMVNPHAAGFSDMTLGTKVLLFDCELLQLAMEFKTFLPIGNSGKGLGNGHVSLEPSLVLGIRLAQDAHLQAQLAEWIPLGGDPDYSGAILHFHASCNEVLCRPLADIQVIGTCEFSAWSFQHGAYTDPYLGSFQPSSGTTYVSAGPGIRMVVCDKIDFGTGVQMSLTDDNWSNWLFRSELRWRY